ncbi:MAG: asparagine synthase C-terminal domain-containing protein [Pseudomonadota bacterium]
MSRYLAFMWPRASDEAEARVADWRQRLTACDHYTCAYRRPGLEVWTGPQRMPVSAPDPVGPVLIGDLFDCRTAEASFDAGELRGSPVAVARRLATDAWGGYVALLPDGGDGEWWAFRDPSGGLPALSWRLGEIAAVADDIVALPPGVAPAELSLDWSAITEVLRRPYVTHHMSLLYGYTPITPGDALPLAAGRASIAVWRPRDFADTTPDLDHAALRETVRSVVGSLASVESGVLLEVSGGFDSSVVASALGEAGQAHRVVEGVHRYSQRPEGDERPWARAVCEARGLRLSCVRQSHEPLAEADLSSLSRLAGPAFAGLDPPQDRDMAARVRQTGATAIFGGHGGDAVFFQMPSAAVVGDLVRSRGLSGLRDPMTANVARWLRRSVWQVVHEALRSSDEAEGAGPWSRFWGERARDDHRPPPHPWLRDLDTLGPGKRLQILALVGCLENWSRSHRGQAARMVQPLLAQPVLEACLGLPVWRLLDGHRDRAFARDAFAPWLPPANATRRAKGALSVLYAKRTAAGLPFLREYLMDGVLVDAGLLDRQALDVALDVDNLMWEGHGLRLGWAAMLEGWVRYWQTRAPDRRA